MKKFTEMQPIAQQLAMEQYVHEGTFEEVQAGTATHLEAYEDFEYLEGEVYALADSISTSLNNMYWCREENFAVVFPSPENMIRVYKSKNNLDEKEEVTCELELSKYTLALYATIFHGKDTKLYRLTPANVFS